MDTQCSQVIDLYSSQAKDVSEIDTHLTAPLFGYSCLEDYYKACQNDDKMHKIRTPFVCITSADDPFVPKECKWFLPQFNGVSNPLYL